MVRLLVLFFSLSCIALCRPTVLPQSGREFQVMIHDINQVEMCISNFGKFGQTAEYLAGCWWPTGSEQNYIWGAGLWFGAIIDEDSLVTVGYSPFSGESEFVPGLINMSIEDPDAVVYMWPWSWPPPVDKFPMAPQLALSNQDSWCAYNDLDPGYHSPGDTRPIGVEVYQTVYAWDLSLAQDVIFVKYVVRNVTGTTLTNCYFGVCTDNDIGNEGGYGNDLISGIVGRWYWIEGESLWVDNLGYQWQEQPEQGWEEFPGTIAFDYLQSPWDLVAGMDKDNDGIDDQYERDSSYYQNYLPDSLWDADLDGTPDWRDPSEIPQIGMNAFKRFSRGNEPTRDRERYLVMTGRDYRTGVYQPYDTLLPNPSDQRFLQCSGPFDLESDSTATVLVGIMLANWYGIFHRPDTALVKIDNMTQFVYDKNWLLPKAPSPPNLTCIPGDAKVTLIWDNLSETEPDPYYDIVGNPGTPLYDPFYRQYDFEGYGVWKKKGNEWVLCARYDLYNGIVFEDTTQPDSIRVRATDTGIRHTYVDYDVRNGFEYSYAVTAFDYNYVKKDTIDSLGNPNQIALPVWYEGGRLPVRAAPRTEPANLVPGICSLDVVQGNPSLYENIQLTIVYPLQMIEMPFFLEFVPIRYDSETMNAVYGAYLKDEQSLITDSINIVIANINLSIGHAFPVTNGIEATVYLMRDSLPCDESLFDSIKVLSGNYPAHLPIGVPPVAFADDINFWAYRGNDYRVHWISTTAGNRANSVVVIDAMTGDTLCYRPYFPDATHTTDSLANGWAFLSNRAVSDTLVINGPSPQPLWNTKWLYICGGLIALKGGGHLLPGDILPGVGDEWYVHANELYHPAPANASFIIHSTPAYFDTETQIRKLNVKMVPNPYIIHNEWQQSSLRRRVKFINLPADCTIRIFNLNGELLKTLRHHHTLEPGEGEKEVLNDAGGDEWWDLLSDTNHLLASGIYVFHIQSEIGEQVGKFVIIQ